MSDLSDSRSYDDPNLPAGDRHSSHRTAPFTTPIIKVLGVMMAIGVTASVCGNKGPKPFDATLALGGLSDSNANKIRELVQADAALCMSGAYPAQSSLPEQLRSVIGTTSDSVSARCFSSDSDRVPTKHAYTLSVGPKNCSDTYDTVDGKDFSFNTSNGNCQSGLHPGAL